MRALNAGVWLLTVLITAPAAAGEPPVDYATQIKPLLAHHCVACHGALRIQGGLRLDASQFLEEGGDSGFTIVAGEPASSTLIAALKGEDGVPRMPQDGPPLSDEKIALIERWIAEGANAPDEEPVEGDPAAHWSFRPVVRPLVPAVTGDVRNPIDAFVIQRRVTRPEDAATQALPSIGEAPKHVLLRRIYLDLIGVPPTPGELRAFLADDAPNAYENVVDRLLDDPRHGERWGRHWMDVWRYSDWYGYQKELRNSQKHIWRWRDWIIESLNADMPYDRMLALMLAADELAPTDPDALRATGFLARNYFKFNRDVWLDRTVEHTGKAFLGITFNCARCHDHMFDPVTQRDYYTLRAFFEPHQVRVDPIAGVLDENTDGLPRVFDDTANTPTYLFVRGNDKQPDKEHPLPPALPGFFVAETPAPQAVTLPPQAFYAGMRPEVRATLRQQAEAARAAAQTQVTTLLAQVSAESPSEEAVTPLAVAEAKLKASELAVASLEARIAADDAKYATPPAADAAGLAVTAATAERTAALAAATANALAAELARKDAGSKPEAERAKAVETTQKALDAARKAVETATANAAKTDGGYSPLTTVHPAVSTGRRTVLANWITDPANPLTARVAVNHVWMRHFGQPLVESVFDFGMHGTPPTHPELLDWLAAEFVASGWDMKHLHRLMVTSATYRLDSEVSGQRPEVQDPRAEVGDQPVDDGISSPGTETPDLRPPTSDLRPPTSVLQPPTSNAPADLQHLRAADPDNRLLWRMNARRAEGEAIRDSLLAISGRLNSTLGGPELADTDDQTTARRSLYYRHAPEKYAPFLQTFDGPNADECYRRAETVVPQQALAQMNSRLSREQSRLVAAELVAAGSESPETLIEQAFERILCRPPTSEERAACVAFLDEQQARLGNPQSLTSLDTGPDVSVPAPDSPRERALAGLIHVLMNHHDFVTIR